MTLLSTVHSCVKLMNAMKNITVMYMEIGCFATCVFGWTLVCSTLAIEYWTYSEVASKALVSGHFFSNLWKDCSSDSTGMIDCKEFPSMLALQMYIHVCRAAIIISIILGLFGAALALVGMKCTKIGRNVIVKSRITFAAGMNYFVSGLCAMFAFSWYGSKIISEFLDPNFRGQKFELGTALFVGWGGSTLLITGGILYTIAAGQEAFQSSPKSFTYSDTPEPSKQPLNPLPPKKESTKSRSSEKSFSKNCRRTEYV